MGEQQRTTAPRRGLRRALAAAAAATALVLAAPLLPTASAAEGPDVPATANAKWFTGWFPYWFGDSTLTKVLERTGPDSVIGEIMPFWLYSSYKSNRAAPVCVHDLSDNQAVECSRTAPTSAQQAQLQRMKAAGLLVMPSITDGGSKLALAGAMKNATSRAALVRGLTGFVVRNGFDGLDLDYEGFAFRDGRSTWTGTKPAWVAFVKALSASLHANGKRLSVTVPGDNPTADSAGYWVYAWSEIIDSVDRLRIMTYDYHFDSAGPIGPADWVDRMAAGAVAQLGAVRARKVWLGLAAYGYDWITASSAACRGGSTMDDKREGSPATLKARYASRLSAGRVVSKLTWNPTYAEYTFSYREPDTSVAATCVHTRTVWFQDALSHERRALIAAKHHLGGVAMWAFGQEEPGTWNRLQAAAPRVAPLKPVVTVAAPRTVAAGARATVTVSVRRADGRAMKNVNVLLQWRPAGGGTWLTVLSARSGADGVVRFTPVPTRNGAWQAVVPAATGVRPAVSLTRSTSVRPRVSVGVTAVTTRSVSSTPVLRRSGAGVAATVPARSLATVAGRVSPFVASQPVTLSRRLADGTWTALATVKVSSTGRYAFTVSTRTRGVVVYRVSTRWTRDFAPGYSSSLSLTVR